MVYNNFDYSVSKYLVYAKEEYYLLMWKSYILKTY